MKFQAWLRALVAGLVVPVAGVCLVVPAGPAAAGGVSDPGGIGIRLLEAPTHLKDDPRARAYIVDHVRPGTTFSRRIEVSNTTAEAHTVDLYAGSARLDDGGFVGDDRGVESELTQWTTVSEPQVQLAAGSTHEATVTVDVPDDASKGERYGVIWASVASPGKGKDNVHVVNRVGVRIYLSVGSGGEPASDFEVSTLTASRTDNGRPVVNAEVVNVGGRAVDMSGELNLTDGPGSLAAGPFPVQVGTTLAPGATAPVVIVLDARLPDGPWHAELLLTSGLLERTTEGTISFPEAGMQAAVIDVEKPWWQGRALAVWGTLAAVAAALFCLVLAGRRGGRARQA
jgi:hypothetical protein